MTSPRAHLLLISLGPVQEFIEQARRTRDLWFGSHLLSELSRAAAKAVAEQNGAMLVFPALERGDLELDPCDGLFRDEDTKKNPPLSVANKVMAEIAAGAEPEPVARAAREAVKERWRGFAKTVRRKKVEGLLAEGIEEPWNEQIDTALELVATWVPIETDAGGYDRARREAEAVLAGRKNLRDFTTWKKQRGSVPKSSLDGGRETVLARSNQRSPGLVRTYRIGEGEQLDAVGLVKRAGGEPEQFVPIGNIALAAWIELAQKTEPTAFKRVERACRSEGISGVKRRDLRVGAYFGFDAQVFLSSRWGPIFAERKQNAKPARKRQEGQTWGEEHVRPFLRLLRRRLREPSPYVACLVADGDRMGKALSRIRDAKGHRAFSKELSELATKARKIVEQRHRGVLVYAGGDDVLAFVTLTDALVCADELRRAFAEVMENACRGLTFPEGTEGPPTLSVGLGVGHLLERMGDLLELGRRAEKLAKGAALAEVEERRNALAIVVDKRSGGVHSLRARWTDWEKDGGPAFRLQKDVELLGGRLSSKKVYEIARDLRRAPRADQVGEAGGKWADFLRRDVLRTLARTDLGGESASAGAAAADAAIAPEAAGLRFLDADADDYAKTRLTVEAWVGRLLIARTFKDAVVSKPKARRDRRATKEALL